jgi:maltose/moltooligosaccharide transporter
MAVGIAGMMLSFGTMHFLTSLNQMMVALVIGGFCWSLININAYPLVVQQCHPSQTGTYTGLYYIFQGVAGAIAPSVAGALFDVWGSKLPLFPLAVLFMGIALALMLSVGRGKGETATGEHLATVGG